METTMHAEMSDTLSLSSIAHFRRWRVYCQRAEPVDISNQTLISLRRTHSIPRVAEREMAAAYFGVALAYPASIRYNSRHCHIGLDKR